MHAKCLAQCLAHNTNGYSLLGISLPESLGNLFAPNLFINSVEMETYFQE